MGIKDLTVFLKEFAPRCIRTYHFKELKSRNQHLKRKLRVAIDTSLFLYKYKYRCGDNFVIEFLEQINRLLINNIQPVYVFDGSPPNEKLDTLNNRKERKQTYLQKINEIKNTLNEDKNLDSETRKKLELDLIKIKKKTISITSDDIGKLKYFLDLINIPHIKRDMEADMICSKMAELNMIDFVISEDMDHLTSGTRILLRDFNNKNNMVTSYNSDIAMEDLNLTREKWIELCILFGCDYLPRIRGVGYKSSYKYISDNKNSNIEDIVDKIVEAKKITLPDDYIHKFYNAKKILLNDIEHDLDENTIFGKKDIYDNQIQVVREYLLKYTTFSQQKINNRLKNIFGYCI